MPVSIANPPTGVYESAAESTNPPEAVGSGVARDGRGPPVPRVHDEAAVQVEAGLPGLDAG
ncbi:hypothetical protein ACWEP2_14185 [Streptomyces sp. NPDC004279]